MTVKYHVTPITPERVLRSMSNCDFLVSFARPDQVKIVDEICRSAIGDNGAWTFRDQEEGAPVGGWPAYFRWCEQLAGPNWRFIIPDVIGGGTQLQDGLIREWPAGLKRFGIPVWHTEEPIHRLLRLCEEWPKVAIGSTGETFAVGSQAWHRLMDDVFTKLVETFGYVPPLHMLRGMQCVDWHYPFESVDSSDVAQNHARDQKKSGPLVEDFPEHHAPSTAGARKAARWDAQQCPRLWVPRPVQAALEHVA